MPTIEISPMQARALARGESITITPPAKKYVVVRNNGDIMLVTGNMKPPHPPAAWSMSGDAIVLHKGARSFETGSVPVGGTIKRVLYNSMYSKGYIEIP